VLTSRTSDGARNAVVRVLASEGKLEVTTGVAIATQRRGVGQARSSGVSPTRRESSESFQLRPPSSLVACQPPGPTATQRVRMLQATTEKASGPRSWERNGDAAALG
jgi:hypothetical protein